MTKTDEQAQKWLDKCLKTFKAATNDLKMVGVFSMTCVTLCVMGSVVIALKNYQLNIDVKDGKVTAQSTSQNQPLTDKSGFIPLEPSNASLKRCRELSVNRDFFQRLLVEIKRNRERWSSETSQDELLNHIGKLSLKSRRDLGSYDKRKHVEFKAAYGMADKRFHRLFPEYRGNEIQLEEVEVSQLWLAVLNDEVAQ